MSASNPHITVDARMAGVSGIGTYIEEIVPRVVARWPGAEFTILGDTGTLRAAISGQSRVRFRAVEARIYSVREQIALLRAIPRGTTLYWAPHYNIPFFYRGTMAVTVHDVFHLADETVPTLKRLYARTMFGRITSHAALVFCDSEFTAAELRRLAPTQRTLIVAPLGVSPEWFSIPPGDPPLEVPYFLAVGNVKPHKNLKRLVAAFQMVSDRIPHRLVIVGRREGLITLDSEVEAMATAAGDRIVFTGHVSRAVLQRFVSGCDALVQPSLYEGFGLPPLEAMACGRPVLVSRAASLPEVCGPHADYFDPMDVGSIASALERHALRPTSDAASIAGRLAWARRYDWDTCADVTRRALAQIA